MRRNGRFTRTGLMEAMLFTMAALLLGLMLSLPFTAKGEALTEEETRLTSALGRGELVRLHILADGDDAESQRVKLCVRDAIVAAFGERLAQSGATNADAAFETLKANVDGMREVAQECARENGFAGEVRADVGKLWLPEKRYGQALLPEGEYRALRVTLGSGAGQNWWCVLFPQLCLAVAGDGEARDADEGNGEGASEVTWDAVRVLRNWTAMAF